ncbi:MAG: hypothetical protein DRH56_08170 [Deltaproteobacteria bacterium]|nr:MAG: hypothetical protein DRH56_08170 [Deltaproteobacteria bacterium]
MENIRKREELQKERRSQRRAKKTSKWIPYLSKGKIFLHKNGGIYAILEVSGKDETSPSITACRIKSRRGYRKRPPRPVTVAPGEIRVVYHQQVDLSGSLSSGERAQRLAAVSTDDLSPVVLPDGDSGGGARDGGPDLPCEACVHLKMCQGKKKGALAAILAESRSLASAMEGTGDGLWLSFRRHLRFLKETGFVDVEDRLTPDGRWASKLRLDQPLLIAEAIRKGAFSGISPDILAGILAPFVWDRDQEVELKMDRIRNLDSLEKAFGRVLEAIEPIRKLKRERGFGDPPLSFGPAAVLFLWARGMPWDTLLEGVSITEGDVASLVMRTADHLRQISSLAETHPGLALGAASAVELILREPVYIA